MKTHFIIHYITIILALMLITSIISFVLCFTFHGSATTKGLETFFWITIFIGSGYTLLTIIKTIHRQLLIRRMDKKRHKQLQKHHTVASHVITMQSGMTHNN